MDTDAVACPSRPQCGCTGPECLDEQIRRVQALWAEMSEKGLWHSHCLAVILYFEDRTHVPFTFTSLRHFTPLSTPGVVFINGASLEHPDPERTERGYDHITRVSSDIVPREARQIYPN